MFRNQPMLSFRRMPAANVLRTRATGVARANASREQLALRGPMDEGLTTKFQLKKNKKGYVDQTINIRCYFSKKKDLLHLMKYEK